MGKRIFFVGVGGQGNILATKLLGEAALLAGLTVSISETHGMALRGGVVESTAVSALPARSSPTTRPTSSSLSSLWKVCVC
jgi:indolepyruvate ferredoxin oxidoreductase, beta subunit